MSDSFSDSQPLAALVTGSGAPRIGNCVARTLAAHGYRVILHARRSLVAAQTTAEELRALGAEEAVVAMVREALAAFGRIDALVNCAAIWQPKKLEDVTAADVRRHFDANTL